MLYHLLYPLSEMHTFFNVFRYITFRTIYATITALALSLILGPWAIRKLASLRVGQVIRDDGPGSHFKKEGTPTMGGSLILFALFISTLLWADLGNRNIWLILYILFAFGSIGFIDDYRKVTNKSSKGLKGKHKMALQVLAAGIVAIVIFVQPDFNSSLSIPFFKTVTPDLGRFYILLVIFIIVGTSNAVNLTDGLDGLAIGPTIIASATFLLFAYLTGHAKIAGYLQIPHVPLCGELAVLCGAMVGAGTGFLWYNAYPAQLFMGDTGSLALGGALGAVAIISKHEFLLVIVGGLFVLETLSVIFQVASYKLTRKRIFRMAPIHHHFELKGWAEPKIIVRFWIISVLLALVAVSTLKLR